MIASAIVPSAVAIELKISNAESDLKSLVHILLHLQLIINALVKQPPYTVA